VQRERLAENGHSSDNLSGIINARDENPCGWDTDFGEKKKHEK